MSSIEALKLGSSALIAYQAALNTTGHNIANVSTPGYSRQRVLFQAKEPAHRGFGDVGRGVDVFSIERIADDLLDAQLRLATGEKERWDVLRSAFTALEGFLNGLSDYDLGDSVSRVFSAMNDVASDVENLPVRNQLIEQVRGLKDVFSNITQRLDEAWQRLDLEIPQQAQRINEITREIADLNSRIVEAESGTAGRTVAGDLRDRRGQLLSDLAKIINVHAQEDARGSISVTAGGRPLVYATQHYEVKAVRSETTGGFKLVYADDGSEVSVTGGSVAGVYEARDEVLARYRKWFDDYAASIIWQINKVHSTGVGLEPRSIMQASNRVLSPTAQLKDLKFDFTPHDGVFTAANGKLTVNVVETATGLIHRYTVNYDLTDPLSGSPSGLVEKLDALDGISAKVDNQGRVVVQSDTGYGLFFSEDTGGILAQLGVGGLLSGFDARTIDLASDMDGHPEFVASGRTLLPGDNEVSLELAALNTSGKFLNTTLSLQDAYSSLIGTLGSDSLSAQDAQQNQSDIVLSLENERQEISGVSLDEELANLIQYQRAYQAVAKFISITDELLDTLIKM